jgi:hypothetical protein
MSGHLSYGLQTSLPSLIGSPTVPVTLTTAYTGNTATFITSGVAMVTFYVRYTPQTSGNAINIQILTSPITTNDGTPVFYPETAESISGGVVTETPVTHTYVSSGTSAQGIRISFPCADQTIKISINETVSSGTAGTASVQALLGSND